jgi:hypothetical protein
MSSDASLNNAYASAGAWGSFWRAWDSFREYYLPDWPLKWRSLLWNPFVLVCAISVLVMRFENTRIVAEMQDWSLAARGRSGFFTLPRAG